MPEPITREVLKEAILDHCRAWEETLSRLAEGYQESPDYAAWFPGLGAWYERLAREFREKIAELEAG